MIKGVYYLSICFSRCLKLGLGTSTDNRTGIFTGISPHNRYFAPVYRSTQCCSDLLSLSSYINGHSQEFDFYARFRGFLVALPRAYCQERKTETEGVVSFPLLEAKMPPYVGFTPFIYHHNKFVFFTRRHFHERERKSSAP